jgi:hypothetical protein
MRAQRWSRFSLGRSRGRSLVRPRCTSGNVRTPLYRGCRRACGTQMGIPGGPTASSLGHVAVAVPLRRVRATTAARAVEARGLPAPAVGARLFELARVEQDRDLGRDLGACLHGSCRRRRSDVAGAQLGHRRHRVGRHFGHVRPLQHRSRGARGLSFSLGSSSRLQRSGFIAAGSSPRRARSRPRR